MGNPKFSNSFTPPTRWVQELDSKVVQRQNMWIFLLTGMSFFPFLFLYLFSLAVIYLAVAVLLILIS